MFRLLCLFIHDGDETEIIDELIIYSDLRFAIMYLTYLLEWDAKNKLYTCMLNA